MKLLVALCIAPGLVFCQQLPNLIEKSNTHYFCKGAHPRCETPFGTYGYFQFGNRVLTDFIAVSEIFPPGPTEEHHQSFIAEIISQRPDSNAVALWGDATAAVDNAVVWGGFLTARTGSRNSIKPRDAELIGLEVNVLNDALPGVYPNKSKIGVRVVGFGNTGTAAFQVFPDKPGTQSGRFENILAVDPLSLTATGTVFGIGPQQTKLGINFYGSKFSDSAMLLSPRSAITFRANQKEDAKIYRDEIGNGHLVLQSGPSGFRVTDSGDRRNLLYIHPNGRIDYASVVWNYYRPWLAGGAGLLAVLTAMVGWLFFEVRRLRQCVRHPAQTFEQLQAAWPDLTPANVKGGRESAGVSPETSGHRSWTSPEPKWYNFLGVRRLFSQPGRLVRQGAQSGSHVT